MRTEADKLARRFRLGSTDIAALTGHSQFRTPIQVYRCVAEGYEEPESELMEIGTLMEPVILELYRRRTGNITAVVGQLLHSNGITVDTPDAFSDNLCAVEAKNVNSFSADGWGVEGTDEVPAGPLLQGQWHMGHLRDAGMRVDGCDFAVLVGGMDFRMYHVRWDAKMFRDLLDIASTFHREHIVPRIPPPVDGTGAYASYLTAKFPEERAPLMEATPEIERWAADLRLRASQLREAEKMTDEAKNRMRALIGDAEGARGPGWWVTWKANKKGQRVLRTKFTGASADE